MMVKQPERRTDRCFLPVGSNSVTLVQFPAQRRPPSSLQQPPQVRLREDAETDAKRIRTGSDEALTNRESTSESCDQTGSSRSSSEDGASPADGVQQVALVINEDNRAAELASAGGLKVTIQRSSESREFGEKEPSSERLTCHICHCSCPSTQAFQQHMGGVEHQRRLLHITQSVAISQHTGGRCGAAERWCDVCQSHFTGDIILHRRSKVHKECKKTQRPFCSVCRRHFRTPRKFVEHMKSPEHKQQVQLEKAQDEEMITVDAVGCFESESGTRFTTGTEGGDAHACKDQQQGDEELGHRGLGNKCLGNEPERGDREGDGMKELEEKGGLGNKSLGNKLHGTDGIGSKEGGGKDIGQKETGQGEAEERSGTNVGQTEAEDDFSFREMGGEDEQRGKTVGKEEGDKELTKETDGGGRKERGDIEGEELMEVDVQAEEQDGPQEFTPQATDGGSYVFPVSGFFCRLCHKFFFRETARDQHCLTQEHLSRVLQSERRRRPQDSAELS